MSISFEVSHSFSAPPERLYNAWLSSEEHSQMTGSPAEVSAEIGGRFEAWNGYISGKNLELEPGERIVQSWRTVDFSPAEEDSALEILFEEANGGTKVTLRHSKLPAHGMQYEEGWKESYFEPMRQYFED